MVMYWDLASHQVLLNSVQWFQRRSRNVSANWRPGQPSSFSDLSEKHRLGRRHWDLAPCQVLLNSHLRFQRRSRLFVLLTFHICLRLRWTKNSKLYYNNYRAWEFTSKEAIWLDVTGSWPLKTRRLHSINGHFSTSRWRYLVTVAKQTTTLLNDTV